MPHDDNNGNNTYMTLKGRLGFAALGLKRRNLGYLCVLFVQIRKPNKE